ncbi:MAG: creatininase [Lachnospiraceae bacterium]|nr:creatininase [Lachnospiraceae bacterium]MEE1250274.1 creatininase [Lachnospiraceae bacterium]
MSVFMNDMTWKEFQAKEDRPLIIPVGSTEQHALHLPLCVDSKIAEGISALLAEKADCVVAPTLSYGYKSKPLSGGGPLFPGTIDLNGTTLMSLMEDLLEEFIRDGRKKIFVMNAHFENEAFIIESIDNVSRRHPEVTIIESNWWDVLGQDVIDEVFSEVPFPGWAFEHAAVTETSLMMYLAPELVHEELMSDDKGAEPLPYFKYPIIKGIVPESGNLAPAKSSSREKGKRIADAAIDAFIEIMKKEFY